MQRGKVRPQARKRARIKPCPILLTADFGRLEMMMKITVEPEEKKQNSLFYEDHGGDLTIYLKYGENVTIIGTTGLTNSGCIGCRTAFNPAYHKPFSGKVILES